MQLSEKIDKFPAAQSPSEDDSELDFSNEISRSQLIVQLGEDGQEIVDRRRQVRVDRRSQTVEKVRAETAARLQAEQEAIKARTEAETLKREMECRSQQLAASKMIELEQDLNNSFTLIVEHELLQSEQDKVKRQQQRLEAARLSPMFEPMRELAFFKNFSLYELAEVLHIGVWAEKKKHQVLLQEESQTSSFFVMMKGEAAVLKQSRLIGTVASGESFGDGFYLMGERATHYASVVASSPVEYLEFTTEPLKTASLEVRYQLALALARSQTCRFRRANERIVNLLTDKAHE